jgi:sensor histidine kinase YesM
MALDLSRTMGLLALFLLGIATGCFMAVVGLKANSLNWKGTGTEVLLLRMAFYYVIIGGICFIVAVIFFVTVSKSEEARGSKGVLITAVLIPTAFLVIYAILSSY